MRVTMIVCYNCMRISQGEVRDDNDTHDADLAPSRRTRVRSWPVHENCGSHISALCAARVSLCGGTELN